MKRYDPQSIEPKWQAIWEETGIFEAPDRPGKPAEKSYVLDMFPYPSADGLHVGHPRPYTASDVFAHFRRYHGHDVFHPMGWDAFGLPAENAAIKKGVHPAANTAANIDNFRRQLRSLGYSYDWQREVNTSDPAYYKWTQWIFLQLFRAGLAYRGSGWQWWCPNDKTVLANEQVVDGHCERCGSEVTKKELTQWYFKITDYADELIDNLADLDWPESIKALQRNWIGRSQGAEVTFATPAGELAVYTTRPDTLFGATYVVLAPEHGLVEALTTEEQRAAVETYVAKAKTFSEIERTSTDKAKTGAFTGSYATNPANGQQIPVWVADYVLASYGTGAIMAVPAHDQRDLEFARKFGLLVRQVVMPETGEPAAGEESRASTVTVVERADGKLLCLDWGARGGTLFVGGGQKDGEDAEATARREVAEETGYQELELVERGWFAKHHYVSIAKGIPRCATAELLHFKLAGESRTEPALEEHEAGMFEPVWLGKAEAAERVTDPMHAFAFRALVAGEALGGEGVIVNSGAYDGFPSAEAREKIVADLSQKGLAEAKSGYKLRDWLISRQRYWGTPIPIVHCQKCGPVAVPEDQLPVELPEIEDYLPTGDGRSPLAKAESFVKTSCPECDGPAERETDTMDTFADSSWYFLRYPTPNLATAAFDPAALKRWLPVDTYVGGADHAVLHLIYARFWTMALADLGHLPFREPFSSLRNHGMVQASDGHKMSKSKGNVVSPDAIITAFGADSLRTYEMFIGPYDQSANWSAEGIEGIYRYLGRVWRFGQKVAGAAPLKSDQRSRVDTPTESIALAGAERAIALGIQKVTRSIQDFRFNTAVSGLMETLNGLSKVAESAPPAEAATEWRDVWQRYLVLLSPFAPHIAEELWQQLANTESIFAGRWPTYDESVTAEDIVTVVVQVNGKVRASLQLPAGELAEGQVLEAALKDPNVAKFLGTSPAKKHIYVPGKILNIVT